MAVSTCRKDMTIKSNWRSSSPSNDETCPSCDAIDKKLAEAYACRHAKHVGKLNILIGDIVENHGTYIQAPAVARVERVTASDDDTAQYLAAEGIDAVAPLWAGRFISFIARPRRGTTREISAPETSMTYLEWVQSKLATNKSTCIIAQVHLVLPVKQEIVAGCLGQSSTHDPSRASWHQSARHGDS